MKTKNKNPSVPFKRPQLHSLNSPTAATPASLITHPGQRPQIFQNNATPKLARSSLEEGSGVHKQQAIAVTHLGADGLPGSVGVGAAGGRALLAGQGDDQEGKDARCEDRPAQPGQEVPARRHLLPGRWLSSVLIPDCNRRADDALVLLSSLFFLCWMYAYPGRKLKPFLSYSLR